MMMALGCIQARKCNTNHCPVGIATQQKGLRARLIVDESARRLANFLEASVELMQVLARACGHTNLRDFSTTDLTTWKRDLAHLTGVEVCGRRTLMLTAPGTMAERPGS